MSESKTQQAFFQYVNLRSSLDKDSPWQNIIGNPNEAKHRNFRIINLQKKEGLKKGFPDISIFVPTKEYAGYFIELKTSVGKPSAEQIQWIDRLQRWGYKAEIVKTDDVEVLIKKVCEYLGEKYEC